LVKAVILGLKGKLLTGIIITALLFVGIITTGYAQENILEAREMPIGTVVTVKGIVTNGSELGYVGFPVSSIDLILNVNTFNVGERIACRDWNA